jgi:hypothetical protein
VEDLTTSPDTSPYRPFEPATVSSVEDSTTSSQDTTVNDTTVHDTRAPPKRRTLSEVDAGDTQVATTEPTPRPRGRLMTRSLISQRLSAACRNMSYNARKHARKWRENKDGEKYWKDCITFADRNNLEIGTFGKVLARWPTTRMRNHLPKVVENIFANRGK